MYSHFTFLSVCHLMTCYDDRFGSSHKRSDCRHLLLFHGIQLLTAVSIIMFASWISVLTSVISIACLGLVLSSQMKWWLSSPFLSRVRWHVLLDSVNVWLFHFLATHPSCGLDYHAASGMTTLSVQAARILTLFP